MGLTYVGDALWGRECLKEATDRSVRKVMAWMGLRWLWCSNLLWERKLSLVLWDGLVRRVMAQSMWVMALGEMGQWEVLMGELKLWSWWVRVLINVNAHRIQRIEHEGRGSDERKRTKHRCVTSGGTHWI